MKLISTHLQTARSRFSRISWGGVLAGALTALTISFLLNLLGFGIGLNAIDPLTDSQPFDGVGTGTIIWWILSNLASLFIGGLVAARTAGLPSATDGGIHGFLAWGIYLLVSIYFITSIAGSIFSATGSLVSSIFNTDSAKEVVINLKNAQKTSEENSQTSLNEIKEEIFQFVERAERYNILPNDSSEELRQGINKAENTASQMIKDLDLKDNIAEFVNDVSVDLDNNGDLNISVDGNKDYLEKEKIKEYLVQNTELSEQEINGVIEKWNKKIENTIDDIQEVYADAKQEALEISEDISDAVGKASIYLFVLLFLGALAAFFGGATGVPQLSVGEEHQEDLIDENLK